MERIVAIDFETAKNPYPCQVGLTIIENGVITDSLMRYIQPPGNEYNEHCMAVHGITPEDTKNCPEFPEVWEEIKLFLSGSIIAAHNAPFDINVLTSTLEYYGLDFGSDEIQVIDTCELTGKKKLDVACAEYGIPFVNHHNAFFDSLACAQLVLALQEEENPTKKETPKVEKPKYHEAISGDVLKKDLTNANPENPFYDKKVVITGVFTMDRKEIAMKLKKLGADVDTSITKKTAFVCIGEDAGPKKLETIKKYNESGCNITTLSESDLISIFNKWCE